MKVTRLFGSKSTLKRTYQPVMDKPLKLQQKQNFWGASYGDDWEEQKRRAKVRDGYACRRCGYKPPKHLRHKLHVHHKIPRSKGGSNDLSNLITECLECHEREHPHMRHNRQKAITKRKKL